MTYAPGNILFSGDSITVGADCISEGGYPVKTIDLLNARDGSGWNGLVKAHGGYKTWQGADVIDADLANVTFAADYVFLYWGANDVYPLSDEGDYTPIDDSWEDSWKAAYTYIIEAIHTKFPNALMWIGKSYRCNSGGAVESWMPNFIFPWTDDLVATIPYLFAGINGAEILTAGFPESMGGSGVHPACYGHLLLAEGIRDEIFPSGKRILLKR